jgi:DNA-binding YbaB/EbfC family protein
MVLSNFTPWRRSGWSGVGGFAGGNVLETSPALPTLGPMAGVGKLLKQAQKMQRSIEGLQNQMEAMELEVTAGGGAVKVKVNAAGKVLALTLDPEFLREDPKVVADTLLSALQDAAAQAKVRHDAEMQKVTSAFQVPGLF